MKMERLSILFLMFHTLVGCTTNNNNQNSTPETKPVADVIPITMANLRGHQALYKEGWFVITSSEAALAYAKKKSVISSRQALTLAANAIASDSQEYAASLGKNWEISKRLGKQTFKMGTRITRKIYTATTGLAKSQVDYGTKSLQKGWSRFVKGNLHIANRTQSTRNRLMQQPGNYFKKLNRDFSNIYRITKKIQGDYSLHIGKTWNNAFGKAAKSFDHEYQRSGEASNSLTGLWRIIMGYTKGLYQGLFQPAAKTTSNLVKVGSRATAQAIFLPAATAISVSGRTIETIGTTVFYTGKLGVEILSPTVEAGLLSGMAMLSLGTAPLTYVTGTSIGAINQVAFTTATPIVTAGSGAVLTAASTGKYVAFVSYDAIRGTSKVVINQASAAVVLGYNALTALPAHAFMGLVDSAVFLAYDGPRLVVAYAKGEVKAADDKTIRVDSLPVGSVVDLKALEQEGVEVEVLSDDPDVIKKIIKEIPNDVRE
ncbi:MAG: hypothetical protein OEY52_00075 [Gammaproteobacteria bacterium]|nr:hypothetical protein [Gammaproteobacteria bacterium]